MKKHLLYLFLGCELLLGLSFLYCDIQGGSLYALSSLLKYAGICLCLLFSWRWGDREITAGLFLTAAADYFLLFTSALLPGVLLFIGVQLCYSLWLCRARWQLALRREAGSFAWRAAATAFMVAALQLAGVEVDILLAVTVFYFLFLVQNTAAAIKRGHRLFAVGMCLFLLCDMQVGIFNAAAYLPAFSDAGWLYEVAAVGMWACYLPAKVCIALAGSMPKLYWHA